MIPTLSMCQVPIFLLGGTGDPFLPVTKAELELVTQRLPNLVLYQLICWGVTKISVYLQQCSPLINNYPATKANVDIHVQKNVMFQLLKCTLLSTFHSTFDNLIWEQHDAMTLTVWIRACNSSHMITLKAWSSSYIGSVLHGLSTLYISILYLKLLFLCGSLVKVSGWHA